jgi:AraC-like DNA-binding protein
MPTPHGLFYSRRLAKVRAHIHANPQKVVSLIEAAEVAGLEPTHFSKLFLTHAGIHFKRWITECKVAQAELLFSQHNYSVTEVASMIGYGDVRSLQRAFRANRLMTPLEFKRTVTKRGDSANSNDTRLWSTDTQELSRNSQESPRKKQDLSRRGQ